MILRDCDRQLRAAVADSRTPPNPLILLRGDRGTGKTTSLRGAVAASRAAGHVALYIPNATTWTHGGGFFCAAEGETGALWYDRPNETRAALEGLLEMHADDLARIPCSTDEAADLREAAERSVDLIVNVDDDWRSNPVRAGHLFSTVVEGLAAQEDVRFVVAIDEADAFAGLTALSNNRGRVVHSCAISAAGRHFGRDAIVPFARRMKNGAVLLSPSGYHPRQHIRASRVLGSDAFPVSEGIKSDPSGSKWLEEMWGTADEGKMMVQFKRFERAEMDEILRLQNLDLGEVPVDAVERLMVLAAGRGDTLTRMAAGL